VICEVCTVLCKASSASDISTWSSATTCELSNV
jgi:hypothetical protein